MLDTDGLLRALRGALLNERRRWQDIRKYAQETGDAALSQRMDQASADYAERNQAADLIELREREDASIRAIIEVGGLEALRDAGYAVIPQEAQVLADGKAMDAILQLAYHQGPVTVGIGGTHGTFEYVWTRTGRMQGQWSEVVDRLIRWGAAARSRKANEPDPGPPRPEGSDYATV